MDLQSQAEARSDIISPPCPPVFRCRQGQHLGSSGSFQPRVVIRRRTLSCEKPGITLPAVRVSASILKDGSEQCPTGTSTPTVPASFYNKTLALVGINSLTETCSVWLICTHKYSLAHLLIHSVSETGLFGLTVGHKNLSSINSLFSLTTVC